MAARVNEQRLLRERFANRGKSLEDLVARANEQYLQRGIAKIRKLPTPYQIVRRGTRMEAIPAKQSGLDYIGVCQGRAITFDCKQTREKNLPLANLKDHQLEEARAWEAHGGIAFWLVEFSATRTIYRVPQSVMDAAINTAHYANRKSIRPEWIDEVVVQSRNGLVLDYLAGLYEAQQTA